MTTPVFPRLVKIRQNFPRPRVMDAPAAAAAAMTELLRAASVSAGQKVGITVGSRGIRNIAPILRQAVGAVRSFGAEPVLLAAMGSHGGGTEAGQRELLESLGITERIVGAPVVCCAAAREIGVTADNRTAYILDSAFEVDHIIPINRIKTHTSFKGELESGLIKKLVVGLGGPQGARQFHSQGRSAMLSPLLRSVGAVILAKMPVAGGIAIIENAYEETALVQAVARETMLDEEVRLLQYAKSLMPGLPATQLDALIVEEMGKNFSGTGMDTNIIGRIRIQGEPEPAEPFIRYIAVWDLTEDSHGNACGIGLADFTTKKLVEKIDRKPTYLNCLTTTFPIRAKIPLYLDTEQEVMEAVFRCLEGSVPREQVRLAVIPNTLFLSECYVSEALAESLRGNDRIDILDGPVPIAFTENGSMRPRLGCAHT